MSCYLDRRDPDRRLCDKAGTFLCQCRKDENKECPRQHSINPFSGSDELIVFSLWDFDHKLERHKLIEKFVEAYQKKPDDMEMNYRFFFDMLFTTKNIRLVYRECHDKKRRKVNWKRFEKKFYKKKAPQNSS